MRVSFFLLLSLFIVISISAQTTTEAEIYHIYLNDGSFLKGYLLNSKEDDPVQLKTLAGDEFSIKQSSITSISKITTDQFILPDGRTINPDGWYKSVLFGFMPAWSDDRFGSDVILGLNMFDFSMGYQFNQYASIGAGLGWDMYDMSIFSIHTTMRGFMHKRNISPYYSLQAGYGIAADLGNNWGDRWDLKGGPLVHPAIGLRFATRKKANFLLEAGYRFQWAERNNEGSERYDSILYRRLDLRFGWKF